MAERGNGTTAARRTQPTWQDTRGSRRTAALFNCLVLSDSALKNWWTRRAPVGTTFVRMVEVGRGSAAIFSLNWFENEPIPSLARRRFFSSPFA